MKTPPLYLILLLTLCLYSCITYVDTEKDLGIKPKLVLFGYLVPQLDTTVVHVASSAPLFTTNPRNPAPVPNAIVELSDNNNTWVQLAFDTVNKRYFIPQTDFPIIEGKTYYIKAAAPEFETVYSFCTVPYFRETNTIVEIQKIDNDYWDDWFEYKADIEWDDYPGEENYYMFCGKEFREDILWNWNDDDWGYTHDTAYFFYWSILWDDNGRCVYSDFGQDGKKMSTSVWTMASNDFGITFFQLDKNCYQFETDAARYDADFHFLMLEPVQLYSNIKNGYGVFGAFVMRDYAFEFE